MEVARGSQRLSGFDFETIFLTCCVLFGICVCFFGVKGFVHAVWYLDFGLLMHDGKRLDEVRVALGVVFLSRGKKYL